MVRGNKIDIEDPDKPGQTTTIDTTKADIDVDDTTGEISIDDDDTADTSPAKQKVRPGQTVKMEDDLEDVVADEFEDIIHMLKQGMAPDEIKKKYPDRIDDDENLLLFDKDLTPDEITLDVEWIR